MKYTIFFNLIIFCLGCATEQTKSLEVKPCPFVSIETNYTTKKVIEGYKHSFRALVDLGLPAKTIKIGNAEVSLSDTSLIFKELDKIEETGVRYSEAEIIERNKVVNFLCNKYNFLMTLDSSYREDELKNFYSQFDRYFNLGESVQVADTSTLEGSPSNPKTLNKSPFQKVGSNSSSKIIQQGDNSINTGNIVENNYGTIKSGDVITNPKPTITEEEGKKLTYNLNNFLFKNGKGTNYNIEVESYDPFNDPDSKYLALEVEKYLKRQSYNVVNYTGIYVGHTIGDNGIEMPSEKFTFKYNGDGPVFVLVSINTK